MNYDITVFGAHPDHNPEANAVAIQAAIDAAAGHGVVVFSGRYEYDQTLIIPDGGLWMRGYGDAAAKNNPQRASELVYVGTGNAFQLAATFRDGTRQIHLQDFQLTGTEAAQHALDLVGESKYQGRIQDVTVCEFTGAASFALRIDDTYLFTVDQLHMISCANGIWTGAVSNLAIRDSWVAGTWTGYGVHVNSTHGTTEIARCIFQSKVQPPGQCGVYVENGRVAMDLSHFEKLYQAFRVLSGPSWLSRCKMTTLTLPSEVGDCTVYIDQMDMARDTGQAIQAQPGTVWTGHKGNIRRPVLADTGAVIPALSPVMMVSASAPQEITNVDSIAARQYDGMFTLFFLDGNTTIRNRANNASGTLHLQGWQDWAAPANSSITFEKMQCEGGYRWVFQEIGRYTR